MAIKYKALSDRRPKQEDTAIELPGGETIKFRAVKKYKDGKLWEVLERLEGLGTSGVSGIQDLIEDMAVDPAHMKKALEEDDALVDADIFGIFEIVGKEFGEQMGTSGESKA
ncbi:hypothetical protein [uncultured Stenotrophomonas sp.]|uniref:hypothetical protein n=1 Tax=uncultured Stenotrophomonas sp. TaxID=165438 RepID=UPI0025E7E6A1|nr:hypothetical protein [uncultured Stenotrophomonas sp.]